MEFNVLVIAEAFVAFVIAITLHEAAHAFAATLLGDSTAVSRGRLSLIPRRQMAPIGTMVALVLSFSLSAGFGWGRPIEIDARRMRVGANLGTVLVALAGPLANAILGVALVLGLGALPGAGTLYSAEVQCSSLAGAPLQSCLSGAQPVYALRIEQFVFLFAITNILIALLNILPLHPLDGYHILFALLPDGPAIKYRSWMPYMETLLLVIFFVVPVLLALFGIPGISPAGGIRDIAVNIGNTLSHDAYALYAAL